MTKPNRFQIEVYEPTQEEIEIEKAKIKAQHIKRKLDNRQAHHGAVESNIRRINVVRSGNRCFFLPETD